SRAVHRRGHRGPFDRLPLVHFPPRRHFEQLAPALVVADAPDRRRSALSSSAALSFFTWLLIRSRPARACCGTRLAFLADAFPSSPHPDHADGCRTRGLDLLCAGSQQSLLTGLYFQPGTRPACSIHRRISGAFASSGVVRLLERYRSVSPSGGGFSKSAPPRKTTFTETS